MIQVDLITGFLGSGKTTFIKQYAKKLMEAGLNIGILLNDYGAVNVDRMLLSDLSGQQCDLDMVAGGKEEPLDRWYQPGNVIAIVEAGLSDGLSETSDSFLASQIAHAGMVIFSTLYYMNVHKKLPQLTELLKVMNWDMSD